MRQWERRWRVTVDTLAVEDLAVRFRVTRSLYQRAGTAEVEIFNLAESHRAELRHYRQRVGGATHRTRVRVEAGYAEGMSVLFQGDTRRVDTRREQTEWVTKVTAGDGEDALRVARGARSFGPATRLEAVVRYVAEALGVGTGNLGEHLAAAGLDQVGAVFPHGTVVHGPAARELTHLLRAAGLEWSIQDGVLQVLPRGGHLSRSAVLLAPATGLIESPEVGLNRVVQCKALLQPDLVPGAQVRLESAVVQGYYRVEQCEYEGESHGQPWDVRLTMRRVRTDGSVVGVAP